MLRIKMRWHKQVIWPKSTYLNLFSPSVLILSVSFLRFLFPNHPPPHFQWNFNTTDISHGCFGIVYLYTRIIFFQLPKNPMFFPLRGDTAPHWESWLRAWHSPCWVLTNIIVIVKINRRPCVPRLQKSIKSYKKIAKSPSALRIIQGTKAQIQYHSQQHLEAGVEPESEDLADEKKARCKAAGQLDKVWLQLLISQLRLPITHTRREEPRHNQSAPG